MPKKRSKASYRRAALKGAATRKRNARAKREAFYRAIENVIIGHHRKLELANRHLKKIQKQRPEFEWGIFARLNPNWQPSLHGRIFVFTPLEEELEEELGEELEEEQEYVVHIDYGSKKRKNLVTYQVHIKGPRGATDEQVKAVIRKIGESGETPKGWQSAQILWSHKRGEAKPVDDRLQRVFGYASQSKRSRVAR